MSTTNNTFGVAFYLKKQKTTQAGKSPIYARITVNGKRIEISVKRSIEDNNWNATKGIGYSADIDHLIPAECDH
jgi:hypothetical protein